MWDVINHSRINGSEIYNQPNLKIFLSENISAYLKFYITDKIPTNIVPNMLYVYLFYKNVGFLNFAKKNG